MNETRITSIHPKTRIGKVSLTVADLDQQVKFYTTLLGFAVHSREPGRALLGAGREDLLELVEVPGARRHPRTTGLYHFAVLLPNRRELARAMARLFQARYPNHPTDHVMTKTTYLRDPEGQEIELYCESPEDGSMGIDPSGAFFATRTDGSPSDGREPLDVEALFSHLHADDDLALPLPVETTIGHVHLYIRDVEEAADFYTRAIGFDSMGISPRFQASFVSAGGYHHHVGLNSWIGKGSPPAPEGSQGMRFFEVILPDAESLASTRARIQSAGVEIRETDGILEVRDPSSNTIHLLQRNPL